MKKETDGDASCGGRDAWRMGGGFGIMVVVR